MAIKRLRDLLTNKSKINYFLWKFLRSSSNITVKLISGEYLDLRPKPFDDVDHEKDSTSSWIPFVIA